MTPFEELQERAARDPAIRWALKRIAQLENALLPFAAAIGDSEGSLSFDTHAKAPLELASRIVLHYAQRLSFNDFSKAVDVLHNGLYERLSPEILSINNGETP